MITPKMVRIEGVNTPSKVPNFFLSGITYYSSFKKTEIQGVNITNLLIKIYEIGLAILFKGKLYL